MVLHWYGEHEGRAWHRLHECMVRAGAARVGRAKQIFAESAITLPLPNRCQDQRCPVNLMKLIRAPRSTGSRRN